MDNIRLEKRNYEYNTWLGRFKIEVQLFGWNLSLSSKSCSYQPPVIIHLLDKLDLKTIDWFSRNYLSDLEIQVEEFPKKMVGCFSLHYINLLISCLEAILQKKMMSIKETKIFFTLSSCKHVIWLGACATKSLLNTK